MGGQAYQKGCGQMGFSLVKRDSALVSVQSPCQFGRSKKTCQPPEHDLRVRQGLLAIQPLLGPGFGLWFHCPTFGPAGHSICLSSIAFQGSIGFLKAWERRTWHRPDPVQSLGKLAA